MPELAGLDEEYDTNSNFRCIGDLFKNYSLNYHFCAC